jgi:serine/threonine protein phosphatase 1
MIDSFQKHLQEYSAHLGSKLLFAVGDIHGCHQALQGTLSVLSGVTNPVIFLGDYLNRGPSSMATIEFLIKIQTVRSECIFLMGNHESMFLETYDTGQMSYRFPRMAIDEYQKVGEVPAPHLEFIRSLSIFYETEFFIFVHGGIAKDPHLPIEQHESSELYVATKLFQLPRYTIITSV